MRTKHVLLDFKSLRLHQNPQEFIPIGLERHFFVVPLEQPILVALRPGLEVFLEQLSSTYELELFAPESWAFGHAIFDHIDPSDPFFKDKLILEPKPTDRHIILDFESEPWGDQRGIQAVGFLQVSPYYFFEFPDEQPVFPVLSQVAKSIVAKKVDRVLFNLAQFLERLNQLFFESESWALFDAIEIGSTSILSGCGICGPTFRQPCISQSYLMTYLARFGARSYLEYDPHCTHLVILSKEEPAIQNAAQYRGVHIVSFDWLIDSCMFFQKMEESEYRVGDVQTPTTGPNEIQPLPPDKDFSSSECTFETSSEVLSSQTQDHSSGDEDEEEEEPEPDIHFTLELRPIPS